MSELCVYRVYTDWYVDGYVESSFSGTSFQNTALVERWIPFRYIEQEKAISHPVSDH